MKKITLPFALTLLICLASTTGFAAGFGDISCEQILRLNHPEAGWRPGSAGVSYQRIIDNGVSKPFSEMTIDDIITFRDKIISCNIEKGNISGANTPEYFKNSFDIDNYFSDIQKMIPIESANNENKIKAENLFAKLDNIELQLKSQTASYKELAEEFSDVKQETHAYRRDAVSNITIFPYNASVEFHNNYGKSIIERADAGYNNVMQLWYGELEQKINQLIDVLTNMMSDDKYSAAELILQYREAADNLIPSINEFPGLDKGVLQERLLNPVSELEERLQAQVIAEIRYAIDKLHEQVKNASSLSDIAPLNTLLITGSPEFEKETQYSALISNPQTKEALQAIQDKYFYSDIDIFIGQAASTFYDDRYRTVDAICDQATRDYCSELTQDLDPDYRDHYITMPMDLSDDADPRENPKLSHLVCAAKNRGYYKEFSAGGFFSSDITLELASGILYFRATRVDLNTLQEVDESFKGPQAINMLIATDFEPVNGEKQPVAQPMQMLVMQLGLPKAAECQ